MTWWQASRVARSGQRVRRIAWRDRWIAYASGLYHLIPVNPVTLGDRPGRVVRATDWTAQEFRARDWTTDPILPADTNELTDVAHIIIRYRWTDDSGTDLDTRTAILGTGAIPPDAIELGFARMGNLLDDTARVGPTGSVVADDTWWLFWGGDITASTGQELLAARLQLLADAFPQATTLEIRLRAHWFGTRLSGDVTIEIEGFTSGTLTIDPLTGDFSFGPAPIGTLTIPVNVSAEADALNVGEHIGTLIYVPTSRSLTCQSP